MTGIISSLSMFTVRAHKSSSSNEANTPSSTNASLPTPPALKSSLVLLASPADSLFVRFYLCLLLVDLFIIAAKGGTLPKLQSNNLGRHVWRISTHSQKAPVEAALTSYLSQRQRKAYLLSFIHLIPSTTWNTASAATPIYSQRIHLPWIYFHPPVILKMLCWHGEKTWLTPNYYLLYPR